jgi:outer membrane receptor protein involved in Fe transport
MNKLYTILFSILIFSAQAQMPVSTIETGDAKVNGILVDSISNQPVEFATISVFKNSDLKKPVDGTLTDDKGKFSLKNMAYGKFTLKITSIGFVEKTIKLEEISSKNKNVQLGTITLSSDTKLLKEVVITGQGAIIEEKVDRLIYNADKDIGAKGGDASDILRKVPLLTVDLEGNVQLRGSSNIKVLINNKPSTIMAASVADALKQIPADQIKTVEVITSPSAKYDAEGSTGIINIITKKNNLEGYSLNVDLAGGNRGGNLSLNGNMKVKKFGMTVGGFGRLNSNPAIVTFEQRTKYLAEAENITTRQTGNSKDLMTFGRYSIGADYDISKTKSLSSGFRFGPRIFNRDQTRLTERFVGGNLISSLNEEVISKNPGNGIDVNLDFLHAIKSQKEFSLSTLYSRSNANSSFTTNPLGNPELQRFVLSNNNKNLNQEFTLQADYQTPIKKNQLVEMGVKGIFRIVNSDFSYQLDNKPLLDPKRPNGNLDYYQNIGATYLAYTYSTSKKYTYKIGARYELTDISADQSGKTVTIDPYSNLVPSLNISKTFGGKYTVKTGYNRRIQRPGLQQLNPNVNQVNPLNIQIGNPELRPELTDNIEASLSASVKKVYINFSAFTRITANAISQVTFSSSEDKGVVTTTFRNIGQDKAYGINLNTNLSITPKWMLNGGIESFYNFINGTTTGLDGKSINIANQGWNLNGRLMSFATLKKGWQVQAFSFVRGSRVLPLGRQGGFGFYSLGVRKEFNQKKGSIGISTQNFLGQGFKMKSYTETPQFYQYSENYMLNRAISINFGYKLGKMGADAMTPKKRAKGVKNDDLKDGEGGGQAAPQGGGAPARN